GGLGAALLADLRGLLEVLLRVLARRRRYGRLRLARRSGALRVHRLRLRRGFLLALGLRRLLPAPLARRQEREAEQDPAAAARSRRRGRRGPRGATQEARGPRGGPRRRRPPRRPRRLWRPAAAAGPSARPRACRRRARAASGTAPPRAGGWPEETRQSAGLC